MLKRIFVFSIKFFLVLSAVLAISAVSKAGLDNTVLDVVINKLQSQPWLLCCAVIMLSTCLFLHQKGEATRRQIPSISVAMGIFFTFVGLSWSLLNIEPGGIQKGTESLISGLSVSFITSVIGLFISVLYRIYFASKEKTALEKMESQAKQAQKVVNDFTKTMEEGINNTTSRILSEFNANLSMALAKELKKIDTMTKQTHEQLANVDEQLRNSQKQSTEMLSHIESTVCQSVSTTTALSSALLKLESLTESYTQSIDIVGLQVDQIAGLTPTANKAMETIVSINKNTEEGFNNVASRLEKMASNIETDTKKSVDNLRNNFANFDNDYKSLLSKKLAAIDETITEGFSVLPNEFKESLKTTIQDYIEVMKIAVDEVREPQNKEEAKVVKVG